jgi:8-oxo-dGTP pyrophosphatase MutT (NUDIX family)
MAVAIPATVIGAQLDAFARRFPDDPDALEAMRALLASVADPCSRTHFVPGHFTASACVLSPGGDAVLLVHHARLDRWLQPGGHIEIGDGNLIDAARREVREECGLAPGEPLAGIVAPVDLDVHAIPARRDEPEHLHFDVRYGFVADPTAAVTRSEESHAVRWFPVTDIDALGVDASARRMIERCRRAL